jgi:hypothetical protein
MNGTVAKNEALYGTRALFVTFYRRDLSVRREMVDGDTLEPSRIGIASGLRIVRRRTGLHRFHQAIVVESERVDLSP